MEYKMSPVTIELRKGRKRRPSNSLEDDPVMDDCMAAMVLMSLSCSPKSTFIPDREIYSVSVKSIDSGVGYGSAASRSNTPSPCTINEESTTASPIAIEINNNSNHVEIIKGNINNESNVNNNQINGLTIIHKDEGIDMDETIDFIIDDPIQTIAEKARRILFKCTWRGCGLRCDLVESIEKHIRTVHLGRSENASEEENDHEEEFYYAEIEEEMEIDENISSKDSSSSNDSSLGPLSPVSSSPESPHSTNYNLSPTLSSASSLLFFAPSPTWSHLDMARPPHEDPEYQAQQKKLQLQLQQQQQQIQIQNQQVQNFNHHHHQLPSSSVTQTIISAQYKPEPERKTVISSPINIPGISVAHRRSAKALDSSSASSTASCNSSYSFSNSHHHHHHHLNKHIQNNNNHHLHHHHNQSQGSFIGSSSSPVNFFSPKAPSKVMRLSSNTSSPINIKSSGSNNNNNNTSGTVIVNSKANNRNVASIISSSNNPTMSTNTITNVNNSASSNQWTSLLQSSSSTSSTSATGIATTLLKGSSISPTRRTRTETRKCRKVYGMDNRDSWCTQCKWKKACTRFVD